MEECFDLNPCNKAAAAAMPWVTAMPQTAQKPLVVIKPSEHRGRCPQSWLEQSCRDAVVLTSCWAVASLALKDGEKGPWHQHKGPREQGQALGSTRMCSISALCVWSTCGAHSRNQSGCYPALLGYTGLSSQYLLPPPIPWVSPSPQSYN